MGGNRNKFISSYLHFKLKASVVFLFKMIIIVIIYHFTYKTITNFKHRWFLWSILTLKVLQMLISIRLIVSERLFVHSISILKRFLITNYWCQYQKTVQFYKKHRFYAQVLLLGAYVFALLTKDMYRDRENDLIKVIHFSVYVACLVPFIYITTQNSDVSALSIQVGWRAS